MKCGHGIRIVVVPPTAQREVARSGGGDWLKDPRGSGDDLIRVSDLGQPDYNFLVAVHELVEMYACQRAGITPEAVDAFDAAWEVKHEIEDCPIYSTYLSVRNTIGPVTPLCVDCRPSGEPGLDPMAPYHPQHMLADAVERVVAQLLGVDWMAYESAFATLPKKPLPSRPWLHGNLAVSAITTPVEELAGLLSAGMRCGLVFVRDSLAARYCVGAADPGCDACGRMWDAHAQGCPVGELWATITAALVDNGLSPSPPPTKESA